MTNVIKYQGIKTRELSPLLEVLRPPLNRASQQEQPLRVAADRFHLKGGHRWVLPTAETLAGYQYIEMNAPRRKHVLTIDVDKKYDQDKVESFPIAPNYLGINRRSEHWQAIFMLESRVYGKWDNRQMEWMRSLEQAFSSVFDGDNNFVHRFSRSPFAHEGDYDWHFQSSRLFSLAELNDAARSALPFKEWLPRSKKIKLEKTYDSEGLMRESYLFNVARMAGYQMVAEGRYPTRDDIVRVLLPVNAEISETDARGGYRLSDLERIARSVSRFCAGMRRGNGRGEPLFTRDQCSLGGQRGGRTQGSAMRDSGRLEHEVRAQNSANASEKHARVIMHFLAGLSVEEIMARESYTDRTTKDVIKTRFRLPAGQRLLLTSTAVSLGIVNGKAMSNQLHGAAQE